MLFPWNDGLNFVESFLLDIYILLLLLKEVGNARLGDSDLHPVSQKTPAPQYQPIEKKRERENSRKQKRAESLGQ